MLLFQISKTIWLKTLQYFAQQVIWWILKKHVINFTKKPDGEAVIFECQE